MNNKNIIISIIVSFAIIIVAFILGSAYRFKYNHTNTINVTGYAKVDFESDIIKWSAYYSRKSMDMSNASDQLNEDKEAIKNFLIKQGINENEILFGAISISRDYDYQYDERGNSHRVFSGYSLSQRVSVESNSLDKVDNASREISILISQGVELNSYSPSYYFSGLENLKLELISQASKNAMQRAQNIAKESNADISSLKKSDLGVFQITGQNDDEEYSYGGVFNTTSRYKTANITVKASYKLK